MKRKNTSVIVFPAVSLSILLSMAVAAQNKYTVKALNGSRFLSSEDTNHGRMSR